MEKEQTMALKKSLLWSYFAKLHEGLASCSNEAQEEQEEEDGKATCTTGQTFSRPQKNLNNILNPSNFGVKISRKSNL